MRWTCSNSWWSCQSIAYGVLNSNKGKIMPCRGGVWIYHIISPNRMQGAPNWCPQLLYIVNDALKLLYLEENVLNITINAQCADKACDANLSPKFATQDTRCTQLTSPTDVHNDSGAPNVCWRYNNKIACCQHETLCLFETQCSTKACGSVCWQIRAKSKLPACWFVDDVASVPYYIAQ